MPSKQSNKGEGITSPRSFRHGEQAKLRPEEGVRPVGHKYIKPSSIIQMQSGDSPLLRSDDSGLLDALTGAVSAWAAEHRPDSLAAGILSERIQAILAAQLDWNGKREEGEMTVQTLPIFTHERLSCEAILRTLERHQSDRNAKLNLFGEGAKTVDEKRAGAYKHMNGWQNRLIHGDSLEVMNSLLRHEDLAGQVQTVYFDPPYGIQFNSNFQPFVRSKDVNDGEDDSMSREPEMVQAYRDTWEKGEHSWLKYLRGRCMLLRELLGESGSCFIQINEKHLHYVRNVMDEVFGRENFVTIIAYKTSSGTERKDAPKRLCDFLVWYAKRRESMRFNRLFVQKEMDSRTFNKVMLENGEHMTLKQAAKEGVDVTGKRIFRTLPLHSRNAGSNAPREFMGEEWTIPQNRHWSHTDEGFQRLVEAGRIVKEKTVISSVMYFDDFEYMELGSAWMDTGPELGGVYVCQTSPTPVERCILMTSDPGDLVFDPTCGGGTTPFVAEQWGRRWIACDVSRVPLALARQRLLTGIYPDYELKGNHPSAGFIYEEKKNSAGKQVGGIVPRQTLEAIANQKPCEKEVLYDRPKTGTGVRICGPFCVESLLPPSESVLAEAGGDSSKIWGDANIEHVPFMINALNRIGRIRDIGNTIRKIREVREWSGGSVFHAEAICESPAGEEMKCAVLIGPSTRGLTDSSVFDAGVAAQKAGFGALCVVGVAPSTAIKQALAEGEKHFGIPGWFVEVAADLFMGDLLKKVVTSEVFTLCRIPDFRLTRQTVETGEEFVVELQGMDIYNAAEQTPGKESSRDEASHVPCWLLDTDYDGSCFRVCQAFFPLTKAWEKIAKEMVKKGHEETVLDRLNSVVSEPFVRGENEDGRTQKVAVKVIDPRGQEHIAVKAFDDAEQAKKGGRNAK